MQFWHCPALGMRCLAAGLMGLLAAASFSRADDPEIRAGYGGYVKEGRSFPVAIDPLPGARRCTLRLMTHELWRAAKPECAAIFEAVPDARTGGWQALARMTESVSGGTFLRAEFEMDDGRTQTVATRLDVLGSGDLLMLAITDRPHDFEFLGGVVQGDRGVARCVAITNLAALPPAWTGLECVDVVVLDGGPLPTPPISGCVRDWVAQGGTLLLTHRALTAPGGAWDFLPPPQEPLARRKAAGADAAWLLGSRTNLVTALQYVDAGRQGLLALAPAPAGALVAGRDFGQGRLLAMGVDWQSLELRDQALYETARRVLWSRVLDMRAQAERRAIDRDVAIPREAQVRHLLGPLTAFACACLLLLGPLNVLVLRRLRRLEYAAVTLPAGAIALSLLAFAGGLALRTRDVVVTEREVSLTTADGLNLVWGLGGVLAPAARTFTLAAKDQRALLKEHISRYCDTIDPALRWCAAPGEVRVEGVAIPRWSMRFFNTWRPRAGPGGALSATAEVVSTNLLRGSVVNGSGQTLHAACVVFRWDRLTLGELAPGATNSFALTLTAHGARAGAICPNCHRVHGDGDPFASRPGSADLPKAMRELIDACPYGLISSGARPTVLAWQTNAPALLEVAGAAPRREASRLLVAEVDLTWPAPVAVPEGMAWPLRLPGPDPRGERSDGGLLPDLSDHELAAVPYLLTACDLQRAVPALRLDRTGTSRTATRVYADDVMRGSRHWYRLPTAAVPLAPGTALNVTWDMGAHDPDALEPPPTAVLSVFNWRTGGWDELGRAATGACTLGASAADHVWPSPPLVLLQLAAAAPPDPDQPQRGRIDPEYLAVALAPEGARP